MQTYINQKPQQVEGVGDQPIADAANLPDDVLAAGGLVKIDAYMRTQTSPNAKRVKRAREKAGDNGMRQVNVVAPLTAHGAIKGLAKELSGGSSYRVALERLLLAEVKTVESNAVVRIVNDGKVTALENLESRLNRFTGWRRFLAKLLRLL